MSRDDIIAHDAPYLAATAFPPLDAEPIPNGPPEPKAIVNPPEAARNIFIAIYLSGDLIEYAWRLVELSWRHRGRYDEGLELPVSSRGAAAGAISLAYAALEAAINEAIVNLSGWLREAGDHAGQRTVDLLTKLPVRDRLDGLAAASGHAIAWGTDDVFQRFVLLVSVRNHLLHHELETAALDQGYWPANALRNLPVAIKSPYRQRPDLHWYDHMLSPAGAEWSVRAACDVLTRMDVWWKENAARRGRSGR